jgi:hypothetical protein
MAGGPGRCGARRCAYADLAVGVSRVGGLTPPLLGLIPLAHSLSRTARLYIVLVSPASAALRIARSVMGA